MVLPSDDATTQGSAATQAQISGRVFQNSLIFVGVLVLAALAWILAHYLLLFFAGILFAILLDTITRGIRTVLPLPRPIRLGLAVLIVAAAFGAIGFVFPSIAAQAPQLAIFLEGWLEWLRNTLAAIEPLQQSLEERGSSDLIQLLPDPAGVLGGAARVVGATISAVTGAILIVIFGLYLSFQPARYQEAGLSMFSGRLHGKMAKTVSDLGRALRRWLAGQILMMLLIGLGSYVVLSALGVPLALMLSFIAGLAAFIPYIGPLIGGTLMVLIAATQGLTLALIVLGFYLFLQLLESYLLTPLIQSRAILVPPAIVILAQVIFGVLFGVLGIALATPLAAVVSVLVKRLYLEEPIFDDSSR